MAAILEPPENISSSVPVATELSQSYFETVHSNLLRLGALTLEDFLRDPYQEPAPQESFLSNPLYHDAPVLPPLIVEDKDGEGKHAPTPKPIFVLHQICSQTFGSIDALNYEIIEEEGKEKKRCILTITRPNGATRSYTSKPEFARKAEARAAAVAVAVDMGAIDFIKHGSPEAVAKRGLVLAPLDAPGSVQEPSPMDAEEDPSVKEIETCCVEWRAGRVKPRWIFLIDSKPTGKYGCALQIKLSLHVFRVFSVDVRYRTFEEAKAACAADAMAEGILEFIKFGNGQTTPAEKRLFQSQEVEAQSAPPPIALTLQGFFESLPRPLPEPVDEKTVAEINAPGWLNTLIQSARGGKFELKFIWTTDTKLGTHGAVLRVARPGEVRTYLVDPQFPKRADAKNAVCLVALAAGVGAYVRAVADALEAKVSTETKALVFDSILPLLTTEYAKFWPNKSPEMFEFTRDRDACGCVLTLKLKEPPEEREKRTWTVPADYRNKIDAKVAVVQHAFEQGAIEFLRFHGEHPPEGYRVDLPPLRESKKAKRKGADGENDGENPKKKPKLLSQAEQFHAATFPSKPMEAQPSSSPGRSRSKSTSAQTMLLPRPGYVDSKPEPGELPPDPPVQPERRAMNNSRRPALPSSRQTREYQPRFPAESYVDYHSPDGHRRSCSDGTREHGRQYELGGTLYDDPGLYAYAQDPYYAPPPAPHTEPWRARHSAPVYPPEDGYDHPYHGIDYGPGYDYEYEPDRYAAPLLRRPLRPSPTPVPVPVPALEYGDFERSGYDYGYDHGHSYAYNPRHHPHHHSQQPPLPPPHLDELAAGHTAPIPPSRRGPPPPSPPRLWEPGPHAAKVDARRSGARSPRSPELLLPAPAGAELKLEVGPASGSGSASSPSSLSSPTSSSSLTYPHAMPASEPATKLKPSSTSCKDELFEYCNAQGHPRPRFFNAPDDTGGDDGEVGAACSVRCRVWVVLGQQRLELPTTYARIEEGEEKVARKVLHRLCSRDKGQRPE